jgi:hypothetical protein
VFAAYYEGSIVGFAAAVRGRATEARQSLASLLARIKRGRYVSPEAVAIVYAGLGDRDRAFARLDRALDDRTWSLYLLRLEPMLDGLRGDPRFAPLVRRVGLP